MSSVRDGILRNARFAGEVRRYHTWPVLRQQSIGEHTWQALRIYLKIWGDLPALVAKHFVLHDMGELVLGDLPFPVKAHNPELKKLCDAVEHEGVIGMGFEPITLPPDLKVRTKIVDLVEMLEFGLCEVRMGNQWAQPIVDGIKEALAVALPNLEKQDLGLVNSYIQNTIKDLKCE